MDGNELLCRDMPRPIAGKLHLTASGPPSAIRAGFVRRFFVLQVLEPLVTSVNAGQFKTSKTAPLQRSILKTDLPTRL